MKYAFEEWQETANRWTRRVVRCGWVSIDGGALAFYDDLGGRLVAGFAPGQWRSLVAFDHHSPLVYLDAEGEEKR